MTEDNIVGVKLATAIAGFAGAVVSLSWIKPLTPMQSVAAVFSGFAFAAYVTPLATHYLTLPVELQNGVSFFLGLTAMNLVPGLIRLSEGFKTDPKSFLRRKP